MEWEWRKSQWSACHRGERTGQRGFAANKKTNHEWTLMDTNRNIVLPLDFHQYPFVVKRFSVVMWPHIVLALNELRRLLIENVFARKGELCG